MSKYCTYKDYKICIQSYICVACVPIVLINFIKVISFCIHDLQILYNRSYALYQLGKQSDALRQLEEALSAAADSSESRHQVIKQGICQAKVNEI